MVLKAMKRQQRDAPCHWAITYLHRVSRPPLECGNFAMLTTCVRNDAATAWLVSTGSPNIGQRAVHTPGEAAPERCYFLIIFCCKIWRFYSNEKIIDNSTYIVGIYDSAEKADLYTLTVWGCCLICITGPPIPYNRIRQKIDIPHLSCTPKFNPFSPGIEEHNNH